MAKLRAFLLGLLLALASPASAGQIDRWSDLIAEASRRFGIPEAWIRRVMQAESGGRTTFRGRPIVSHAGAQGLMQVMPETWREMRAAHGLGPDPHAPRDNILAGTAYLRAMYDRFGYPGLFAAYNAGPARYAGHLARGRPLPAETVAYLAQVAGRAPDVAQQTRPAVLASVAEARPSLFVVRGTPREDLPRQAAPAEPESSLFFPLRAAQPR